jgi:hypothetical protein
MSVKNSLKMLKIFALFFSAIFFLAPLSFGEGEVKDLKQFEYWENKKIRTCTVYDVEGYIKAKAFCRTDGTVEKAEKFDKFGNRIEEAFYDQKGRLKNGVDGWAAMRWWYEEVHIVAQVSYDEAGVPLDRRYYSESGKLILRQYREDAKFNPYEDAAMAMLLGPQNVPCVVQDRRAH